MSDKTPDEKKPTEATSLGDASISRRKLAYVAPLFLTSTMFYRAAGCGKSGRGGQCGSFPAGS